MTARRTRGAAVTAAVAGLLLAGCTAPGSALTGVVPACSIGEEGRAASGVVLMAQSVPTASFVPCVHGLPLGWHFSGLDARSGSARFWLDSDRDGVHAIEVRLTSACDTDRATEISSDRPRMQRFERVIQVEPEYRGRRHYLFDGGCLTLVFTLAGDYRGEPLALATQGIGVLPRDVVADQVRESSGGRLALDPPEAEEQP